jgi:hypothetical protein
MKAVMNTPPPANAKMTDAIRKPVPVVRPMICPMSMTAAKARQVTDTSVEVFITKVSHF